MLLRRVFQFLVIVNLVQGCTTQPPKFTQNVCNIFEEKKNAAIKSCVLYPFRNQVLSGSIPLSPIKTSVLLKDKNNIAKIIITSIGDKYRPIKLI